MNSEARRVVKIARRLGFAVEGIDGNGHIRLCHSSGERVSIPSTPSESRSAANQVAMLQRIAGVRLDKPNAGRHSHVKAGGLTLDEMRRRSPAEQRAAERIDELQAEHALLAAELDSLRLSFCRRDIDDAKRLAADIVRVERELRALWQPHEPLLPEGSEALR